MSRRSERRGGGKSPSNIGVVWLIAILLSTIAGYVGGQSAGIRPAFGNLHLLAPPLIGTLAGLFCFPLFRVIFLLCFGDDERTRILSIIGTLLLAGFAGKLVTLL